MSTVPINHSFELWDIFARVAVIGELGLISAILLRMRPLTTNAVLSVFLCVCCCGFLLLTVPYSRAFFGEFRSVFLVLTEVAPFMVWLLSCRLLLPSFSRMSSILSILVIVVSLLIFTVALILERYWDLEHAIYESIHALIHWIELGFVVHVVYMAYSGLKDDLKEPRRKTRLLIIAFVGAFFAMLALAELFDFKDTTGLINAYFCLAMVTYIGVNLFNVTPNSALESSKEPVTKVDATQVDVCAIPAPEQPLFNELMRRMDEGLYRQSELTITELAEQLNTPEHQLRKLINQHLDYSNFSSFLNGYRVAEACTRLKEVNDAKTSVLTIAMGLGYGSVAPFNRAFKASTGLTPTQYRQTHLKGSEV
jgi:AraC-like DNA-binding protein